MEYHYLLFELRELSNFFLSEEPNSIIIIIIIFIFGFHYDVCVCGLFYIVYT